MTENSQRDGGWAFGSLAVPLGTLAIAAAAAVAVGPETTARRHAIGFAAAACAVGPVAGWIVSLRRGTSPAARVAGVLASVGLRLFPALAALGWLQAAGGDLRANGADGYLVVFYLSALAADVVRMIMEGVRGARRRSDKEVI